MKDARPALIERRYRPVQPYAAATASDASGSQPDARANHPAATPSPRPSGERVGVRGFDNLTALASSPRPSPPEGEEREKTLKVTRSGYNGLPAGQPYPAGRAALPRRLLQTAATVSDASGSQPDARV